ncbi:MAG TPA: hypothetical protein PLD47_02900 [Aggregatilineales bacterium]|nr:hypothetical protein [Anaerolineales bacterium]HRE46648.1 hypothetical protein [Aggregatilineales bacterium]
MRVPYCHVCESDPTEKQKYGESGLAEGEYCPVCFRPFCRHHSGIVRWRWKDSREADSARICIECKRAYSHRSWDAVRREWIS